jgi:hypothetical protein
MDHAALHGALDGRGDATILVADEQDGAGVAGDNGGLADKAILGEDRLIRQDAVIGALVHLDGAPPCGGVAGDDAGGDQPEGGALPVLQGAAQLVVLRGQALESLVGGLHRAQLDPQLLVLLVQLVELFHPVAEADDLLLERGAILEQRRDDPEEAGLHDLRVARVKKQHHDDHQEDADRDGVDLAHRGRGAYWPPWMRSRFAGIPAFADVPAFAG